MKSEPKIIPIGWSAFVAYGKCNMYKEFPTGGKYYGQLTLISKPTEAELKAELTRLKITLPE